MVFSEQMGANSNIEWTSHTFNPWLGCVKVSPACKFCYAEADRKRRGQLLWGPTAPRQVTSDVYWKQPLKWNRQADSRDRVFCGSLCDVMEDFGGDLVNAGCCTEIQEIREHLYQLIELTPNLDWLLLTKRPENYRRFLPERWLENPQPNVWLGTTVESPDYLDRIDSLKSAPAVVHFLSIEPLLADLPTLGEHLDGIEWVICGGESGPHARPMNPDWVRRIRDFCIGLEIPFLFKQWGEWCDTDQMPEDTYQQVDACGIDPGLVRIGKKKAGRILDGRTWDEVPSV
jgi:protein gp37